MGQCYSVDLKIKGKNNSEEKAAGRLRSHMLQGDKTNYNFKEFSDFGVGTEKLDDLIQICLAGWKSTPYYMEEDSGWKGYYNDFDASYGWDDVMKEMFETLTPFMEDRSKIDIYPDGYSIHGHVENGKCNWIYN